MSDYKQTRDAAGNITSQYGQMLRNLDDDLVERLRNTPNWMREGFQDWKDNVRTYDRTPFEAADRIEELEAKLEKAVEVIHFVCNSLHEINPSNYDHDDVCILNDKSVEAIISLSSTLAELKGETDE